MNEIKFYIPKDKSIPTDLMLLVGEALVMYVFRRRPARRKIQNRNMGRMEISSS